MNRPNELHTDYASERIERELVHRVLRGTYRGDDYLPTIDRLCQEFAVSYHTVRGALARLAARGLILLVPGIGARVVPLESSLDIPLLSSIIHEAAREPARRWMLVAQVCGFLRFLHKEMADRAALHADQSQLEWMRHLIRLTTDRVDLGSSRYEVGECEHQFSRVLSAASGCITHTAIINSMRSMFVSEALQSGSAPVVSIKDYWALTEAIANRDPARAREVMDVAWWILEEQAIAELKKLGWNETPGGAAPVPPV